MAGRSRRFSTIFVDEIDDGRDRIKCIDEGKVLYPASKSVHLDDLPCFVLEDTSIYLQDGKTMMSLLNAELQGPFLVRGRLVVDGDLRNRCKLSAIRNGAKADLRIVISKKLNGQYIEIAKCESFSIGDDPITVWALGKSGWLEIQPSETYQKVYNKMVEAISIFYFVTDLYEKEKRRKGSKKPLSIDKILLNVCKHCRMMERQLTRSSMPFIKERV
jgi:hypothetical protein